MSKPDTTRFSTINRRQLVVAGATASAGLPLAMAFARQEASPLASPEGTPNASPAATPPPPTPTPDPVPDHSINIVETRAKYGDPKKGGNASLRIQKAGLTDGNPALQTQDMTLLMSVFEGLVRINPTTMEAEPGLAESWEWSADNLTLTFKLRNDVAWHDGSSFTAADAALTCIIYRDDYDSNLTGLFALVESTTAIDDTTLAIQFLAPDGAFLYNGASMPMLPSAIYQPLWDEFVLGEKTISREDISPANWIGTGPWRIGSIDGDRVTLQRFDDYWDGPAHLDELELVGSGDDASRVDAWKSGEIDVLPVSVSDLPSLWEEDGNLFVSPSSTAFFAAFNFHNPANATSTMMVDHSLRTALNLAVDRERYSTEQFYSFMNETAVGTMAQPWLHDDSLKTPKRDIEAARATLAAGGWVDYDGDGMLEDAYGNKTDLYAIVREDERPELLALLNGLQADWGEIGVRLTIQQLSPEIFDARWTQTRDYDLIAYSLVNYPAFNEFDLYGSQWDIRSNRNGWNPGGYYNANVDAAIWEWFAATDPDAMKAAASAIQSLTNEDLFGIWFGFPHDLVVTRPDIQGFNGDIFLYSQNSHRWWRGEGVPIVPTPEPAATPDATPVGSPVASPEASPVD